MSHLVSGQALIGTIIGLMDTTNDESVLSGKEVGVLLRLDLFALKKEIRDEFTFIFSFLSRGNNVTALYVSHLYLS